VPPNLLLKLKNMAHASHPTNLLHQYFVDGPVTVADVWLGSGDGTSKNVADWKTILVFGEGIGAGSGATNAYLWSSSTSCASGFSGTYSSTYSNYCGYYAFDATNATTIPPTYLWRITPNSTEAPYLGEPWSKMYIGRVIINGNEKWVGFIGGGYNASDCSGGGGCDTRGKGFYVIDLSNGNVLWSYTRYNNINMNYSLPAPAAIVDTDNDGFIDTAYIGDLGNNVWKLKFCKLSQGSSCSTSNWSGQMLFDGSSGVIRPIFTVPTAAKDQSGNLWVYWATGNKADPTSASAQEKFYALKDSDATSAFGINDLDNITTGTYSDTPNKKGWYINLGGQGEKVLGEPTVFGGVVYFTTYTPSQSNSCCERSGTAKLYGVNYTTGAGVLTEAGARSITIGSGIPSAPLISFKPGGALPVDLYVTVSGGGGSDASTIRVNFNPPTLSNRSNILFWRDRRVQ
jgi:type IV pilus assembly protein PilY1